MPLSTSEARIAGDERTAYSLGERDVRRVTGAERVAGRAPGRADREPGPGRGASPQRCAEGRSPPRCARRGIRRPPGGAVRGEDTVGSRVLVRNRDLERGIVLVALADIEALEQEVVAITDIRVGMCADSVVPAGKMVAAVHGEQKIECASELSFGQERDDRVDLAFGR